MRWKAEGADFLRSELNFFNSRDYRAETALNLLERWGCMEGDKLIAPLTPELLNEEKSKARLKAEQQRLLDMINYIQKAECRAKYIYEYFGVESSACGKCDKCVGS